MVQFYSWFKFYFTLFQSGYYTLSHITLHYHILSYIIIHYHPQKQKFEPSTCTCISTSFLKGLQELLSPPPPLRVISFLISLLFFRPGLLQGLLWQTVWTQRLWLWCWCWCAPPDWKVNCSSIGSSPLA